MKNVFCYALCGLLTGAMLMRVAWADDYNLKITGTIVPQTCDVTDNSKNQMIYIGDFSTAEFPSTGSTSAEKDFSIDLTGCTPGIAGAKVMFSGTSDATNPTLLALSDTGGGGEMATGVAVEILDGSHQAIAINNSDSTLFSLQEGNNSLPFFLRYKSTSDTVTAGNATAVMYFDLQYQ